MVFSVSLSCPSVNIFFSRPCFLPVYCLHTNGKGNHIYLDSRRKVLFLPPLRTLPHPTSFSRLTYVSISTYLLLPHSLTSLTPLPPSFFTYVYMFIHPFYLVPPSLHPRLLTPPSFPNLPLPFLLYPSWLLPPSFLLPPSSFPSFFTYPTLIPPYFLILKKFY